MSRRQKEPLRIRCPNTILHPWLKAEFSAILTTLPPAPAVEATLNRTLWQRWQEGLQYRITLAQELPPLRLLVVMDNLAGHLTPELVLWLFAHGIMPLYIPLSGSWGRDHYLVGSDSLRLESYAHTVCVGWEASAASRP